jgi:hypothetical protein
LLVRSPKSQSDENKAKKKPEEKLQPFLVTVAVAEVGASAKLVQFRIKCADAKAAMAEGWEFMLREWQQMQNGTEDQELADALQSVAAFQKYLETMEFMGDLHGARVKVTPFDKYLERLDNKEEGWIVLDAGESEIDA